MTNSTKPTVLITGVSGYIGSYVCKVFLEHGGFNVRGTVRSLSNESKIQPLKDGYGEDLFSQLELVEADLMDADSIMAVAEGCDYIVHTASPVAGLEDEVEDEDVVIKPAVDGTLAVMKAAQKAKVKKVVITSSVAAVGFQGSGLTEKDWTDVNAEGVSTYHKSKTLAEKAAWDFIAELSDDEKFPLATINPAFVFGPNVSTAPTSTFGLALALVQGHLPKPLLNTYEAAMQYNSVDVRDVSQAHLEAVLRDEANDKRFILCAESESEDVPAIYIGNRAVEVLGIKYVGHMQSMADMKASMIATGCIEADNVALQQ